MTISAKLILQAPYHLASSNLMAVFKVGSRVILLGVTLSQTNTAWSQVFGGLYARLLKAILK
jgi:hypothetical protein